MLCPRCLGSGELAIAPTLWAACFWCAGRGDVPSPAAAMAAQAARAIQTIQPAVPQPALGEIPLSVRPPPRATS